MFPNEAVPKETQKGTERKDPLHGGGESRVRAIHIHDELEEAHADGSAAANPVAFILRKDAAANFNRGALPAGA